MSDGARLAGLLFPGLPVAVEWVRAEDGRDDLAALADAERALVARAVPVRVRAFALGRRAAHAALAQAGAPPGPLVAGPDRAPRWPAGFLGSIAHTEDVAIAAAARQGQVFGLGVDVEPLRALQPELWRRILTTRERAWLEEQPERARGACALRVFCAKEAVYKAWYPRGQRVLEFAEVEVELRDEGPSSAQILGAPRARADVRLVHEPPHLVAAAVVIAP